MNISKVLFLDTNYDTIGWDKNVRYIIERVVTYGNLSDWNSILEY